MNKSILVGVMILLLTLLSLAGCAVKTVAGVPASAAIPATQPTAAATSAALNITPQGASQLIEQNAANPSFVVLDVRTADEFASGHIAGAINVDYYATDFKDQLGKLDKSKGYLVYCRTGARSAQAVQIMLAGGFQKLWNMTGGITAWTADGLPTVN